MSQATNLQPSNTVDSRGGEKKVRESNLMMLPNRLPDMNNQNLTF